MLSARGEPLGKLIPEGPQPVRFLSCVACGLSASCLKSELKRTYTKESLYITTYVLNISTGSLVFDYYQTRQILLGLSNPL